MTQRAGRLIPGPLAQRFPPNRWGYVFMYRSNQAIEESTLHEAMSMRFVLFASPIHFFGDLERGAWAHVFARRPHDGAVERSFMVRRGTVDGDAISSQVGLRSDRVE